MEKTKNQIHIKYMQLALKEARRAEIVGEVPVGAVLVIKNKVISTSSNSNILDQDPTSHAEINVIRNAAKKIGNYRLKDATLYVTLEPCAMCYGAIIHARISGLVFGAFDPKTGVCGSSSNLHEQGCFNHKPFITGGILKEDCSLILKDFFKKRRN